MTNPLWISEQDVVSLMSLPEAIDALEKGLNAEALGQAKTMLKTHVAWGKSTLHAIGAVFEGTGYYGTKTWGHTPNGATPLFVLWNETSGRLCAVIEAFALGQMRTGGISGVATKRMSPPTASKFAIIGTGKQALPQVAAVCAVRNIETITIFSRQPAARAAFAEKVKSANLGAQVIDCSTAAEATAHADIITLATRATTPILSSAHIKSGAHVNAIGAITPERQELANDCEPRLSLAVADDPAAVRKLSREFREWYGEHDGKWQQLLPLSDLVNDPHIRGGAGDITLFKAMGMGISDLSLAVRIYEDALQAGLGHSFPHPERAPIRLRS